MGINKILAGIDLGPDTERVAAYALWLAQVTGAAGIGLIHVVDYALTPPAYVIPFLEAEKTRLDEALGKWVEKLTSFGTRAEGKIVFGRLIETFRMTMRALGPDIVVVGYKGHSVRASSSERLIKSLEIPLLVVRGKRADDANLGTVAIKKILCAVDFSEHSQKAFELARALTIASGSELDIVHVVKPFPPRLKARDEIKERYRKDRWDEAQNKMESLIGSANNVRSLIREGTPREVIIQAAEESGAAILFMGARGLSYLRGLLLGSVTDALIKSSPCPVMIVH